MNALLLIGSSKLSLSASQALGSYLCERLRERGWDTETLTLWKTLRSKATRESLLAASDRADLVVLALPLYADSLPAPVVQTLELIAAHRHGGGARPQRLLAIVNSGFPEAAHNDLAVAICAQFARQTGFEWAGGLRLGGGGVLGGQPISATHGPTRAVAQSLDLAAAAVADGKPVPSEAIEAMARPLIPNAAYLLIGSLGWLLQARQNKNLTKLWSRPYAGKQTSSPEPVMDSSIVA